MENVRPCLPTDQLFTPTDNHFVSPVSNRAEDRADQGAAPRALTRKRRAVARSADTMRACELLSELGVPREMVTRSMTLTPRTGAWGYYHDRSRNIRRLGRNPRSSFWYRPTSELYDLLEVARTSYREKIKRTHPDKNPESHHEAARLNMLWRKTKALFRRHGIEFASVAPMRSLSYSGALIVCLLLFIAPVVSVKGITLPSGTSADSSRISMLPATDMSWSQLTLSWIGDSTAQGYLIERSTDLVNFVQIGQVLAPQTSYRDTGLTVHKAYYYRLRAYNSAGVSGYSGTGVSLAPGSSSQSILMTWNVVRPVGLPNNVLTCATIQNGPNASSFTDISGCQYCSAKSFTINYVAASTNRSGIYRLKLSEP